jgi:hypothetical protein
MQVVANDHDLAQRASVGTAWRVSVCVIIMLSATGKDGAAFTVVKIHENWLGVTPPPARKSPNLPG